MPGTGKYTQYAPPATDRNVRLNKLFRSDDDIQRPITQDLVGKEDEVRMVIVEMAKQALQPAHQTGDLQHFPEGVDMHFQNSPDLETVEWTRAGDPANSYAPDISSPGPGKTAGTDKDQNPDLSVADLKPNYIPGAPGTYTNTPSAVHAKIIAANILGVPGKLGDSGGNI